VVRTHVQVGAGDNGTLNLPGLDVPAGYVDRHQATRASGINRHTVYQLDRPYTYGDWTIVPGTLDVEEMTDPVTQDCPAGTNGDAICNIFGIAHLHVKIISLYVSLP